MNQSANLTTAAPKTGDSSFSFKRLGQLLKLDFAFHHRQWIQILIGGFLAASIPVIVSALSGLLFGMGWSANEARSLYLACLYCSFLAVSLGAMTGLTHYNSISKIPSGVIRASFFLSRSVDVALSLSLSR